MFIAITFLKVKTGRWTLMPQRRRGCLRHLDGLLSDLDLWPPEYDQVITRG